MNDMLKRLLSFTLALVMVFGMMPAEALASELDNTEPTVTPTEAPTEVVTEAPATEHSHAHEGAVTTAATCEAEGVMTYTCSCGDTYTEAIAALGHTYVDGFCACGAEDPDGTPANDGNKGDDVPEETTEAPEHTHAHEGVVTTEATCTEDGVKTFTCPCGDSYTEAIAATGHAYEDGVCGVCGAADPDYEEKPELSGETRKIYYYNVESWDEVWAAWSFDEDGFDDVAHPGEELSSNTELEDVYVIKVPVEADEVLFSDGIEVTEELLEQERLAGVSVTHEIEVRLAEDRYYDLYQNGAWANYAQTVKALEETEPETEAPAEHTCSYEGTVTKEATCEEAGEMTYACTCGESNTEVMPALGHEYAEGKCTRCGAADPVAEVQAMIEALPTSFATQAEVDNFWDVTAAELDAAIEALTAEQQEQLDTARYDAAIDAAAAFTNPEFNDWTTWETPKELLDGEITESALAGWVSGPNGRTRYRVNNGSWSTLTWTDYTNKKITFSNGDTIEIETGRASGFMGLGTTWNNDAQKFVVKMYHELTVNVTNDPAPADSGIKINGITYADGAKVKVNYNAAVTVEGVEVTGYTIDEAPTVISPVTSSQTVSITYKADVNHAVVVNVNDVDGGDIDAPETVPDGGTLTITVTPHSGSDYAFYVESVSAGTFVNNNGKVTITVENVTESQNITINYAKETFDIATSGYEIKINGFSNETKAVDLKKLVLDAIFGEGNYNANDYKVEMLTEYKLGSWELGKDYYDVTGYDGTLIDIPASWFVTQLAVDGKTQNNFKITKLASSNQSGKDLSVENVMFTADESRKAAEIQLTQTVFNVDELDDVKALVKAAVQYKKDGAWVDINDSHVTVSDITTAGKQSVTITVTKESEDYLKNETGINPEITVTLNPYTVTWVVGGKEPNVVPYHVGDSIAKVENPAAPEGHYFAGWDTNADGEISENETVAETMGNTNLTYTAIFTPNTYTVTWTINGEAYATTDVVYGTAVTAPAYDVPEGHTFGGWEVPTTMPAENITLDANLTVNQYTVTWKWKAVENGEVVEKTEPQTLEYGTSITAYTVDRYYEVVEVIDGEETTVRYYFQKWIGLEPGATVPVGGKIYEAEYAPIEVYEVKFDAQEGEPVNPQYIEKNGVVIETDATTIREGYRFDGWYLTGEDGELAEVYDFATPVTADITLTAKWVEQVTVTFDVEGIDDQVIDINTKATKPADPDKEYAIFGGWFNGETEFNFDEAVAENVALTAKWIADVNDNNVLDENETVTIVVNKVISEGEKVDEVQVDGAINIEGTDNYIFDSTSPAVTITATPVTYLDGLTRYSTTYVAGIEGAEGTGSYANYAYTYTFTAADAQEITVNFADAAFVKDEDSQMPFLPGLETATDKAVYDAVIKEPKYENGTVKVEYLAREAGTYQFWVPVLIENIPLIGTIGGQYIDVPLSERWVSVNETFAEVDPESIVADKVASIRALIADGEYLQALREFGALATNIAPALNDYKCHIFGANGTEKIRIAYTDDQRNIYDATLEVHIYDYREESAIAASDVTFYYGEFTQEAAISQIGAYATDVDGNAIETDGTFTYEGFLPVGKVGVYPITIKYAGDMNYQPAETTVNVTIVKAPVTVKVPNTIATYGDGTKPAPTFLNRNGEQINVDAFQFMLALDVAELDVNQDGVHGLNGKVQLILPKAIQDGIDLIPGLGKGSEHSLQGLMDILNKYSGTLQGLGLSQEILDTLNSVLGSITGITETANLTIIIGGEYQENIGVYLVGAVTADSNYETAFGIGYLVIKPQTTEYTLEWNEPALTNAVVTLPVFNSMDKGAHAVEAEDYEASYLILGINDETGNIYTTDIYGNIKLNIWSDPNEIKDNGAYVQIAYGIDWGNEFAYAMPIIRSFAVVPALYDVQLVGATGEPNDELLKTFNNQPQGFSVIVKDNKGNVIYSDHYQNVVALRENAQLVVNYVGVQTNGQPYNSNEKPVHAGVYAATAVYMEFNDGQMLDISNLDVEDLYELFDLADIGADMGLLVIEPAESTINVEDKIVAWDGTHYVFADQVTATSPAGVNPDKTIISAGINTDGDFSENGWAAVGGTVNVDFPRWIDELIAQYAPSVVEGISVKEFSDKLVSKLPSIAAKLEELGATNEMLHSLTNAVTSVAGALENVPENVKLSFNDDAYASSVGAYVIIGIVTDSDHIPSVDAGLLVIAPDVNPVELKWNYEDEDNIWTRELLKFVDLKATAYSTLTGERNEAATDMITHKFIGIDKKGNLIVKDTRNADELPNGAYFELAYIKLDVDGAMTVSNLIAREILLVPGTVEVAFVDAPENNIWNHTFDNTPKAVEVVVTNNGKVVEPKAGELTVTYTGIQTNGKIYRSTEAPVHAGAYTVAAEYVEYTAGGSLANIGAAAGFITIAPAEATINVADSMIVDFQSGKSYDLEETMVTVGSAVPNLKPDTTIISAQINTDGDFSENGWAAVNGNVNVDFPRWMDELLAEQVPGVKDGITAAELKEKLTAKLPGILSKLEDLGATNEIINSLNNLVGNLNKVLAQIPDNMTLTFKDDVVVSSVGAYAVAAIVTDSDHIPAADAGVLVILPEVDVVDLKWNHEDANNIWTRELLEEFDLWAKAYDKESGELDAGATAVIHYQFIGMDKNGSLLVIDTDNANDLPNGVYTELAYIELEIDGHMYISDLIARTVIIVPNAAEVKFVDVNGNNARRFVFDNTQKTMDVTVVLNGEVITPAEGTLTFTYNGIQTNGKTYNSTTAPVHAGVYTVMAEYADYTEGGSLAHYGAAAGIIAIEPAASTMDVTGGTVTYDGEGHTATVVATGSGVTEPDYTLISGGAYVSGDINEVGVDAFHGNVNIDFPAWLDKALAEHEFKTEGVDAAYLTDFISSYRDDALALIPVEALVKLGVAEEEINSYIAKLNGYIDELLAVLEKLPAGVALTFNDDVTYTEPGYYFYYGIVTDSDHYPSADTGMLVIEKKEILFDLLDTKVTWNGKGQMVDLNNPENADFVTVVIDRKNNTINIVLDEDAQYALNAVAKLLGVEFDGDVQMSTILDKYNGKEVADAIVKLIDEAQKLNLSEEIQKVLAAVKAELETLPTSGTITVNGELPTELGVYEVYAISYSQHFKTTAAEAELEIVPVRVEVTLNEVSKVYGEKDPELTYTVKYYDHEGNEMTGVDANITVQISREAGEDVGTYAITGTVTLGDNTHFELIKQPVDSKFTITKATDNTWTEEPGIEGWTYGETAKTPVGEAKYGEIKVEYRPADDPDAPFTTTVPTDAGDYIVRFTVEGTDNYNGITVEKELTIAKAASKITEEPKAVENLVYDGENHALITAGVAEGGKLVYSLSENGPFSEEIPVGKEAGTYTVYYKVAGDNNHNDSEVKSITVKIKEDHTGEYPIDMSAFANQYTIKPGATVEIDGVPYTLDEDCIAWVKNTDAKIVTTYKYHEGNTANETYPTNMYVWYLTTEDTDKDQKMDKYNAERIPELDNLFEYNGTSIRVGAAKNGIRFFTSMNPSTRTKLQSGTLINTSVLKGAKMVRAGTVFKKNPEVQVTLENGVSSDVYGGKAGSNFRVFGTYSGRNWFTGMLVGLDTDAETVTAGIAARPYAQLQIGDETVVIYGGQIQRSIYYVACQNQDTFAQGSAYDQFVEGLIAKGNSIRGEG